MIAAGPNQASASPLYIPALAISDTQAQVLWWAPFPVVLLLAVALLALRYRRFGHEQRLQIIWPLLAALSLGLALGTTILSLSNQLPELEWSYSPSTPTKHMCLSCSSAALLG